MKILFITRGFPTDSDPMKGNYESVQAKALAKKGHEVICISIYKRSIFHIFKKRKITYRIEDGVSVYEMDATIPYMPHFPHFYSIEDYFLRNACDYIYKVVAKKHGTPDIIHSHCLYVLRFCSFLKGKYKVPLVHTEHWSELNAQCVSKETLKSSSHLLYPDEVITVSKALSCQINKHLSLDCSVIHNMVSDSFWNIGNRNSTPDEFRFISIGRLEPIKRYDLLLKGFAKASLPSNVKLILIGSGSEVNHLKSMIISLGLEDRVSMLGQLVPQQVAEELSKSDCCVCTSVSETFGITLIEAMAKGLPVISVPCGGPEEIIIPEIGILTSDDSENSIANAMNEMHKKHDQYNSDFIMQYCYSNYSQHAIACRILDLYNKVIERYGK